MSSRGGDGQVRGDDHSNFANLSMPKGPNVSHEDPWLGHCDCMRHGTSIPDEVLR